jgi:zinc protease
LNGINYRFKEEEKMYKPGIKAGLGVSLGCLAAIAVTSVSAAESPAQTQTCSQPSTSPVSEKQDMKFNYHKTTLKNGLTVLTLEDFSCPIVTVQIWYHVGSKNEDPNRQGFAHMFEHMMFRGTDRLGPTDHFGLVRQVGGSCNGYTGFDRTVYLETLPANQLELALWLEAERMSFLKIDQESFDTERKVVEEERRQGLNSPYGSLVDQLLEQIYKVHPYRWPPIGKIDHLRASTVGELRDFWLKYYVPNNATLVIVGAVNYKDANALAEKYFGWIPKYSEVPTVTAKEPEQTKKRCIMIKEPNAPAPGVGIVYRTTALKDEDTVALDLLAEILGGGNSSRIYRDLVADKQMAMMAQSASWSLEQDGIFGVGAVLAPMGGNPDKTLQEIRKQIERVRTEPVTEKELTKAKNQRLRSIVTQSLQVESKASMLGTAAVEYGDVSYVNRELDEVKKVTAKDLLRVAKKYLTPERSIEVKVERNLLGSVIGGKSKEEMSTATAPAEKVAPKPGRPDLARPKDYPKKAPLAKFVADKITPEFSRNTLPNGLKVLVVSNHEVPFVTIQLGLKAGAWTEDKPGTTSMAMQMLSKGTKDYTEGELAEELETYAISLTGGGEMDNSSISVACLSDQVERAMKLLDEVVQNPTFPKKEFNKLRKQVITSLTVSSAEPEYAADKEYRKALYGNHPYARTATGEVTDVGALTVNDLKTWWQTYARPENAVLIIAGDISNRDAVTLAKKTLGCWKASSEKPLPTLPKIEGPQKTRIYLVDRPGSIQSQIRIGELGITRKNPDYYVTRVVSSYFGWDFNSRLNKSVRVDKGLTYSIWGSYIAQNFAGDFRVGTFSKTDSTVKAVQAAIDEIKRLRTDGPTKDELDSSKSYILGSFVGERETPQQIANDLWLIESQNLGDDYLERLLTNISKTKSSDCLKLVDETIDPNKLVIVVVGEAKKLKAGLSKIAPVTVIEAPAEPAEPTSQPTTQSTSKPAK